jgi:diguanylate cyclase (GGDEF)-like protein/PAS domain S-box-containing protein
MAFRNLFYRCILLTFCLFSIPSHGLEYIDEAFERHSAVMLIIDPESGKILDANAAARAFYGYDAEHFSTKTIQQINLLSKDQVEHEIQLAKAEHRNYFIFRHQLADSSIKTVHVYSSPYFHKGKTRLLSIIQDISEHRAIKTELWHYQNNLEQMVDEQVALLNAKNALFNKVFVIGFICLATVTMLLIYLLRQKNKAVEQSHLLSQIVEQSPSAIMTIERDGNINYVNQKFEQQQSELKIPISPKSANLLSFLSENTSLRDSIAGAMKQNLCWSGEISQLLKGNKRAWHRTSIYPIKNTQGQITQFATIATDITKLKEDEKQLRLASTVFQTATEAVMICDMHNKIQAVNDAFTHITGYQPAEVMGKNPGILSSGNHGADFYQQMKESLQQTDQWQGEICNRRKNGEVYYEWLSITALRDDMNQVEAYVSLFSDITKKKKAEDKIYHQANFDTLTGLANRNLFIDRFNQALSVAERKQHKVALMFLDLDGFKHVNDILGHSNGDKLLQFTAKRLESCIRKSDTVTRLGGDEFAIILTDNPDIYSIETVARKIQTEIARPFELNAQEAYVTASLGITLYPEDGLTVEDLLIKADSAMYKAKANGRNNFQFFTKEMDDVAQQRRNLESELRAAAQSYEFELVYQPIHHCKSNHIASAEALIRWRHPKKGLISPAKFIPLAEKIGVISQISEFVINEACKTAANWLNTFDNPPAIAVNISSVLFQQRNLVDTIVRASYLQAN